MQTGEYHFVTDSKNALFTDDELRTGLAEMGLTVSVAGLHRFFVRRGMTRKKRLAMPSSRTGPMS